MTPLLALPFVCGFVVTLVATPLVIWMSPRSEACDRPDADRHIHDRPVSRLGGTAVYLGLLVGFAVFRATGVMDHWWAANQQLLIGLAVTTTTIFLLGLVDDLVGLPPWFKLLVQAGAACVAYAYGFGATAVSFGYASDLYLGWLALPLNVLWVVGITNAFNLIDGLDGLATGIALIALAATAGAALIVGDAGLAPVTLLLLGTLLAFLRYNFSPAKIFLGDSGSLSVGFLLALLSLHAAQQRPGSVLAALPLSALAFPVLDTVLAMARRWLRGAPFSRADARHIHHRLLALGYSHRRGALILWAVALAMALFGVLITVASPALVAALATAGGFAFLLLFLYGLNQLSYHEFSVARTVLTGGPAMARALIREQISAHDVVQLLRGAGTKADVDALLAQASATFGFAHMEFNYESRLPRKIRAVRNGQSVPLCRVEYPLLLGGAPGSDTPSGEPLVLRIWCGGDYYRLASTAQRVARILAEGLTEWVERHPRFLPPATQSTPSPDPVPAVPTAQV